MKVNPSSSISSLLGALNYVRAYRKRIFVIKLGGEVVSDPAALRNVATQIALLSSMNIKIVLVHGGGPQADQLTKALGREPRRIAGRRITDDHALQVAKMVFSGSVNTDLVAALRAQRLQAVGLTGVDSDLLVAHKRPPVSVVDDNGQASIVDFGHVGDIDRVDTKVLTTLMDAQMVPVVASLASDDEGHVYNVNADTVAERIAIATGAMKLIFLTGAPGVLRDRNDPTSLVTFAEVSDLAPLIQSGAIAGGMRPKVEACIRAATGGVERTHIIDGRAAETLLVEVFTGTGSGTMIVGKKEQTSYVADELPLAEAPSVDSRRITH